MVKLSLLVTIGALLGNVSWASAKSNFGRRTFILPQKNADHVNTNTDAAISVRGGGQYEDIAKKAYYVLMASQGLTTALAPEKTGDILFNGAFTVDEDSLSSFLVGYAGSSCECSHYMLSILYLLKCYIIRLIIISLKSSNAGLYCRSYWVSLHGHVGLLNQHGRSHNYRSWNLPLRTYVHQESPAR